MIFFTADQHFGHENIIEYCNRPFSSVEEMDEEMIRRWNEKVGKDDTVFHLGDFTLGSQHQAAYYWEQLSGFIYILNNTWHHDKRWINVQAPYMDPRMPYYNSKGISIIAKPPLCVLEPMEARTEVPIVLCHYPLARWDRGHYGSWHLHGHSHSQYQTPGLIYDVGVDNNDFYPVSLDQVVEIMLRKERIMAR